MHQDDTNQIEQKNNKKKSGVWYQNVNYLFSEGVKTFILLFVVGIFLFI